MYEANPPRSKRGVTTYCKKILKQLTSQHETFSCLSTLKRSSVQDFLYDWLILPLCYRRPNQLVDLLQVLDLGHRGCNLFRIIKCSWTQDRWNDAYYKVSWSSKWDHVSLHPMVIISHFFYYYKSLHLVTFENNAFLHFE